MGDILRLLWFWLFGRGGKRGYWVIEVDYTWPSSGLWSNEMPGSAVIRGWTGRGFRVSPRNSAPMEERYD